MSPEEIDRRYREFDNLLPFQNDIVRWILMLSSIASTRGENLLSPGNAGKILEMLAYAEHDPEFRATCLTILEDISTACGDRVALSTLHMEIAFRLRTIRGINELSNFLIRTVWPIQILEDFARNKLETLEFGDEIEAYLGYPVALRERLGLEIDVQSMLYFRCSRLTEQDLDAAANRIQRMQGNEEEVCRFLSKRNDWKNALKAAYPQEFNAIMAAAMEEIEGEDTDFMAIENTRVQRLAELTERALREHRC